jgi:hypothetical protein
MTDLSRALCVVAPVLLPRGDCRGSENRNGNGNGQQADDGRVGVSLDEVENLGDEHCLLKNVNEFDGYLWKILRN